MDWRIELAERGWMPDPVLRFGIRRRLRERVGRESEETEEERQAILAAVVERMRGSPIAVATERANEQHYEVPAEFFALMLGPRLKYSAGFWPAGTTDLTASEEAMLHRTCENAGIEDGMEVLELGCGWGSFCLWIAEHYPGCRVVAITRSEGQRRWVEGAARSRGLGRLSVLRADVCDFDPGRRFDRVVSIEMFEHVRNYELLLRRIAGWLRPQGRLFVHSFCHRRLAWFFDADDAGDWMARHFFAGGMMPSQDLLAHFDRDLECERQWHFSGEHYQKTLEAWLANLDRRRAEALRILAAADPSADSERLLARWRIFLLACSETFGFRRGQEWWVTHYLLRRKRDRGRGQGAA